jgi:hypothetical protein
VAPNLATRAASGTKLHDEYHTATSASSPFPALFLPGFVSPHLTQGRTCSVMLRKASAALRLGSNALASQTYVCSWVAPVLERCFVISLAKERRDISTRRALSDQVRPVCPVCEWPVGQEAGRSEENTV